MGWCKCMEDNQDYFFENNRGRCKGDVSKTYDINYLVIDYSETVHSHISSIKAWHNNKAGTRTIDGQNKSHIFDHFANDIKMKMLVKDITINCVDCGKEFTFTLDQQNQYVARGWNAPKRCKCCREKKRIRKMTAR